MNSVRWLDIVRHRIRGFRAPYLLILQHHDVPSTTRLVAPVTLPLPGDVDALAPPVMINDTSYRARILDTNAIPLVMLGDVVASAHEDADTIMNALDIILRGYPVGLLH